MNLDEITSSQLRQLARYLVERFVVASARNYLLFFERGKRGPAVSDDTRVCDCIRRCVELGLPETSYFSAREFYLAHLAWDLRHLGVTSSDLKRLFHEKTR